MERKFYTYANFLIEKISTACLLLPFQFSSLCPTSTLLPTLDLTFPHGGLTIGALHQKKPPSPALYCC